MYHRPLLTNIQTTAIRDLLEEAIIWLEAALNIHQSLKTAITSRLRFRKLFLTALDFQRGVTDAERPRAWEECSKIITEILETKDLGTAVDASFSGKIQRRLASSVPPRPVVNIGFDDACSFLGRLCTHGKETYNILQYGGPSCAMVSTIKPLRKKPIDMKNRTMSGIFRLANLNLRYIFGALLNHYFFTT